MPRIGTCFKVVNFQSSVSPRPSGISQSLVSLSLPSAAYVSLLRLSREYHVCVITVCFTLLLKVGSGERQRGPNGPLLPGSVTLRVK